MNSNRIIYSAFGLVIAAILLTTITWEIDIEVPYYAEEPYTFEQTLVREQQVIKWPWFWERATQVQYLVKNSDRKEGTFTLNFLFDNGNNLSTKTTKLRILSGEAQAVTIRSNLPGKSTVSLRIVPPNKAFLQYRIEKKTVNTWYYIPGLKQIFW